MTSVRSPLLVLLTLLLLASSGCDDTTAPGDLGDLNPLELANAVNDLVAPLEAGRTANANLNAAVPDLTEAGIALHATRSDFLTRAFSRTWIQSVGPLTPLPATFPPEVVGETFVFEFEEQRWAVDETLEGAPADGVRLRWYSMDGSGRVQFPLEERGYVDLRPGSGDGAALEILSVETGETGGVVLLDFGQNRMSTGGDLETETLTAAGFFADGSSSTDFDIRSEETSTTSSEDASYDLRVTLENETTVYTMRVDGTQTGATGDYEDRITATAVRGGATTVLEMLFRGSEASQEEATGTLVRNGTLIANIDIVGNSYDFSTPDGGSFSAGQSSALNALFTAMTRNGFLVLLNLPLVLP